MTDSDTDDVDDQDQAVSELDSATTKNQSSARRSKDSSTYSVTSAVDQELGGHSSVDVEATVRHILQDANLPWLTFFVVDELREAFACPLCRDVLDQHVVCPDCEDVVGCV